MSRLALSRAGCGADWTCSTLALALIDKPESGAAVELKTQSRSAQLVAQSTGDASAAIIAARKVKQI